MARLLKANAAVINALFDSGIDGLFPSGILEFRTGAPGAVTASKSGSEVASITVPADPFSAASGGILAATGTWEDTNATGGTIGHFVLEEAAQTTYRIQGTVGAPGSAQDSGTADSGDRTGITDAALSMAVNEHVGKDLVITGGTGSGERRPIAANSATQIVCSPGFNSLLDNTSIFEVVDAFDVRMANVLIAATDTVRVDSFSLDLSGLIAG